MKKLWIIMLGVVFLSACSISPTPIHKPFQQHQQQLARIKQFKLNGQFSLVTPNTQLTGNLIWNQCDSKYHIQLFGPLGIGHVRITGNQNQVILQNSRNQIFTANNPEALMQQQLGWSLPLSQLKNWIKGQNTQSQHNWIIQYQAFQSVDGIDLPVKIRMQQGQVFSKLVISEWKINFCEID